MKKKFIKINIQRTFEADGTIGWFLAPLDYSIFTGLAIQPDPNTLTQLSPDAYSGKEEEYDESL